MLYQMSKHDLKAKQGQWVEFGQKGKQFVNVVAAHSKYTFCEGML